MAPKFTGRPRLGQEYIYRVVAKLWLDNPENKEEVDHIGGLTKGNGIDNLQWATRRENARGYNEPSVSLHSYYKVSDSEQIFETQQEVADYLGCAQAYVSMVLNPRHGNESIYGRTVERVFTKDSKEQIAKLKQRILELEGAVK